MLGEPLLVLLLLGLAILAGTIGGVVGFGSIVILLPATTFLFGPQQAIPILTVAALMGNLSRAAFSWQEADWPAVATYGAGAVPAAILGAFIFVSIDAALVQRLLGLFLLLMLPGRRWAARQSLAVKRWQLFPLGVAMGLLSGIVGTVGPINAPFFLAYGLVKGAYLATEALGAAAVHVTKAAVYGRFALIDAETLARGLFIGLGLLAGAWLGKRIVLRLEAPAFVRLVEALLAASALWMILSA